MCMCVCVYVHMCIRVYVFMCLCVYVHMCVYVCMYVYTYLHICIGTEGYIHTATWQTHHLPREPSRPRNSMQEATRTAEDLQRRTAARV